jgi:excisionase family DNA binding protein
VAAHPRDPGEYPSLSPNDVAALLGLNAETVRRMARAGKLRAYKVAGRVKFSANDVDRLAFGEPVLPLERADPVVPTPRRTVSRSHGPGSVSRLEDIERDVEGLR